MILELLLDSRAKGHPSLSIAAVSFCMNCYELLAMYKNANEFSHRNVSQLLINDRWTEIIFQNVSCELWSFMASVLRQIFVEGANIRWKEASPSRGRLWLIHLEEEHCWWLSHRGHTLTHPPVTQPVSFHTHTQIQVLQHVCALWEHVRCVR